MTSTCTILLHSNDGLECVLNPGIPPREEYLGAVDSRDPVYEKLDHQRTVKEVSCRFSTQFRIFSNAVLAALASRDQRTIKETPAIEPPAQSGVPAAGLICRTTRVFRRLSLPRTEDRH